MKILVDTNILISAILWPNSKHAAALLHVARFHELVLCDRNIFELRDVLRRKAPQALADVDVFLAELAYDLVPAETDKRSKGSADSQCRHRCGC